jgi:N4-gp56 family major capsid protein
MALQTFGTQNTGGTAAARIGKFKAAIIEHAMYAEVLVTACKQVDIPKNSSDTAIFRSWVPYGATPSSPNIFSNVSAAAHITQEGVTPAADTLVPRDVTAVLYQYSALYGLTDKDEDLYEDDVQEAMKTAVGERMGLVRELIVFGIMKGATSKFYPNGVTSRAAVNGTISDNLMANIARYLNSQHAKMIRERLAPTNDYATAPIEPAFVVFVHTDMEFDIRRLSGFVHKSQYSQYKVICERELGSAGQFRYVISPELSPYAQAGAAQGSTGMYTSGSAGANVDVYPMIVLAENSVGALKLRGENSFKETLLLPSKIDKNDPLGQRGYIGAKFYYGGAILNPGWIVVAEIAATALS